MKNYGHKRKECYEFSINGRKHKVPLPASMSPIEQNELVNASEHGDSQSQMALVKYFQKYVGDDLNELTMQEFSELIVDWSKAGEDEGASLGE